MNNKIIKQLVEASYTKDNLDNKKVEKIASLLSRSDLKLYIRGLKIVEKSKTIHLVLPDRKFYNKSLLKSKKRIVVDEDPSLIMGAKIIDNDLVYDLSLKNNLDRFINEI